MVITPAILDNITAGRFAAGDSARLTNPSFLSLPNVSAEFLILLPTAITVTSLILRAGNTSTARDVGFSVRLVLSGSNLLWSMAKRGSLLGETANNVVQFSNGSAVVFRSTPYHVVAVAADGQPNRMYIDGGELILTHENQRISDGVILGAGNLTGAILIPATYELAIGDPSITAPGFVGTLGRVVIYPYAITASQAAASYRASLDQERVVGLGDESAAGASNRGPVAVPHIAANSVNENASIDIPVGARSFDADGTTPIAFKPTTPVPPDGVSSIAGGLLRYTPSGGTAGRSPHRVPFGVRDAAPLSSTSKVLVNVTPPSSVVGNDNQRLRGLFVGWPHANDEIGNNKITERSQAYRFIAPASGRVTHVGWFLRSIQEAGNPPAPFRYSAGDGGDITIHLCTVTSQTNFTTSRPNFSSQLCQTGINGQPQWPRRLLPVPNPNFDSRTLSSGARESWDNSTVLSGPNGGHFEWWKFTNPSRALQAGEILAMVWRNTAAANGATENCISINCPLIRPFPELFNRFSYDRMGPHYGPWHAVFISDSTSISGFDPVNGEYVGNFALRYEPLAEFPAFPGGRLYANIAQGGNNLRTQVNTISSTQSIRMDWTQPSNSTVTTRWFCTRMFGRSGMQRLLMEIRTGGLGGTPTSFSLVANGSTTTPVNINNIPTISPSEDAANPIPWTYFNMGSDFTFTGGTQYTCIISAREGSCAIHPSFETTDVENMYQMTSTAFRRASPTGAWVTDGGSSSVPRLVGSCHPIAWMERSFDPSLNTFPWQVRPA